MKTSTIILIFILVCASIFAFLTVRFTNYNLERTFRVSSQNAFYLISFVVDHYLNQAQQAEEVYIQQLRNMIIARRDDRKPLTMITQYPELKGIWVFERNRISSATEYEDMEKEIVSFYQQNLRGKDEHTLIMFGGKPFFLINITVASDDILLLVEATVISGMRIEQVLDSLVTSSNLRYFAIVNADNTPILFSTLYENFLPLKGAGQHIIDTPDGKIFQIEEVAHDNSIVAGFDMESLNRILRQNNIFLVLMITVFVILEGALIASYWKFERFRLKKEKEINRFKEVGALSTGFAHEFRNSLHALTLLAKELDEENSSILLDETTRMKAIMDSLRLLSTKDIERIEIKVADILNESTALLDHIVKENSVEILQDITKSAMVRGNRALLVTALSNIIKNSIEARARNIRISAHRKGRRIRIEIADDGVGIERSITGQIFDPFFSKKGQSGIGLYLTKRIIQLHDGEIEFTHNEHTVFSITLPE
ncbi:MAG: HAMP domain-containing sensor histidine kinase [bacterium]